VPVLVPRVVGTTALHVPERTGAVWLGDAIEAVAVVHDSVILSFLRILEPS
jgi:hypothetical protein